jgi:hypothetical protein
VLKRDCQRFNHHQKRIGWCKFMRMACMVHLEMGTNSKGVDCDDVWVEQFSGASPKQTRFAYPRVQTGGT